ncbi:hypothetical protein ZIOFF_035670 [Zingiber officinale]|uniref:RING-CH-type domain-containing protein n=1 Tax=Zingiber officinale TaxID=94328 RepID=A0A8J5G9I0_ZINOF|nr:hypothetical protein ZIOFF_035670 [Zingiber officinale]
MVGDFMVPVDSVVESAVCLDTSHRGRGWPASYGPVAATAAAGCSVSRMINADKKKKGGQVVECRICQEEGDECDLESPCACTGTLKVSVSSSSTLPLPIALRFFLCSLPIENVSRNGAIRKGTSFVKSAARLRSE